MKYTKLLFSVLLVTILVVATAGCITSPEDTAEQTNKNAGVTETSATSSTPTWTPREWTAYDSTEKLDSHLYIGSIDIDHTSTISMTIKILDPRVDTISYIGIIPASELTTWKQSKEIAEYKYLNKHIRSNTFTATLEPGSYYFVIGLADPVQETLASGTEVIKARSYLAVPLDLSDTLYVMNLEAYVDIREDLDIDIVFTTPEEYKIFTEGGTAKAIEYYKKAKSGYYPLADYLEPGLYYFILDNGYSLLTKKTVDYRITSDVIYPATVHITIKVKEKS
ncbi:hypothetical protein [Thermococcus sp. GR6]|uniref:hypothetical protein n=1 Tax=Thermococcus sp. GR6 TaxID=1638256 RepID=UPI001431D29E|nr:hypothetical protein [Thermococcus sp. GR6]NJE42486.1 hypothetical protein [Thermococcus sp. GR6]